jgi:hypothetical protein
MLRNLESTFGLEESSIENKVSEALITKQERYQKTPVIESGIDKNKSLNCNDSGSSIVDCLNRLSLAFDVNGASVQSDASVTKIIEDIETLNRLTSVVGQLEKRFRSAGVPLLNVLEKLDAVLAAKDAAFSKATKASFDRIIDSMDPNKCVSSAFEGKSNRDGDDKVELFGQLKEKHMQLSLYHKQGRLVKDCRIMYKQQLKKYGF